MWRPVAATGVGSMPGTSAHEATRIVAGELPDFLHVVELPARGPGSDLVGRTAGLLASVDSGFGLETTPLGWRISKSIGREMRRAQSWLREDLDALEDGTVGYEGPVKAAICGPWTLAAQIELPTGERMLRDPRAVHDLAQALGEAARLHIAEVQQRVPKATVVLQVDEPALPTVLAGRIGTASGLSVYAPVDDQTAELVLREVLKFDAGVHCCAGDPPVDLLRASGAAFIGVDLWAIGQSCDEALGRAFDAGVGVMAGCVPSTGDGPVSDTRASAPARDLLHRLGLTDARWLDQIAVTPSCGLAGASPTWTRTALASCRAVGRVLRHDEVPEEDQR